MLSSRACNLLMSGSRRPLYNAVSRTAQRMRMLSQHVDTEQDHPVIFHSDGATRQYILNRPTKMNALNQSMIDLMKPQIKEWNDSQLCRIIIGSGEGRAFCGGGDIRAVLENIEKEATRHLGPLYFKEEFELDFILASLKKPYVAIWDGFTMGGGVGLTAHAPFRIATERTQFAMPETKIGYAPDVGASYFLSRLDGELGTYLALTSNRLIGRAVFEHGLATHFVPSSRLPTLLSHLASLDDPTPELIDRTIEELYEIKGKDEPNISLVGSVRSALDRAFRFNSVEQIFHELEEISGVNDDVSEWAAETLSALKQRSPTSLKVSLELIRRGKNMNLAQALEMEYGMSTAYCNGASSDFKTGVKALFTGSKEVPSWNPSVMADISHDRVISRFFDPDSSYTASDVKLDLPPAADANRMKFGLPSEDEIRNMVAGTHGASSSKGMNYQQILETFRELYPGKGGLDFKVAEAIERKCTAEDDPNKFQQLRWIA